MTARPITTEYAGCRFRSRLEARWAVFFDVAQIRWDYEVEGYTLPSGARYLPDFYLPSCGTWIEVKGDAARINWSLLHEAAVNLPQPPRSQLNGENGPVLMLLGPIPRPLTIGDYGWMGWSAEPDGEIGRYGFGTFHKNLRPWWLDTNDDRTMPPLEPITDEYEWNDAQPAYRAARQAQFEHGVSGIWTRTRPA